MIEVAEIVLHKADEPYVVGDLQDADILAGEDGAEVDLLPVAADASAARHCDRPVMEWIAEFLQAPIRSGRTFIAFRRISHTERLMGPFVVIAIDEVIELRLLLQEVLSGGFCCFLLSFHKHRGIVGLNFLRERYERKSSEKKQAEKGGSLCPGTTHEFSSWHKCAWSDSMRNCDFQGIEG